MLLDASTAVLIIALGYVPSIPYAVASAVVVFHLVTVIATVAYEPLVTRHASNAIEQLVNVTIVAVLLAVALTVITYVTATAVAAIAHDTSFDLATTPT